MNVNKTVTTNQTVELLEGLRTVIQEFAALEEKLNQGFDTKIQTIQKKLDKAVRLLEDERAARIQKLEADSGIKGLQVRYEQRKARIDEARRSSQRLAEERIEDREGRRKYAVQKGTLENDRSRSDGLKQNEEGRIAFAAELAREREELAALDAAVRKALRGYGGFFKMLEGGSSLAEPAESTGEDQMLEQVRQLVTHAWEELKVVEQMFLPRLFRQMHLRWWLALALVCGSGLPPALQYFRGVSLGYGQAGGVAGGVIGAVLILYFAGQYQARRLAASLVKGLTDGNRLIEWCEARSQSHHTRETARIEKEYETRATALRKEGHEAINEADAARDAVPPRIDEKWRRITARNESLHRGRTDQVEAQHATAVAAVREELDSRRRAVEETARLESDQAKAVAKSAWDELVTAWNSRIQPFYESVAASVAAAEAQFPSWEDPRWRDWTPPESFRNSAKFGHIELDLKVICETVPRDPRLALPASGVLSLPLVLMYPEQGSILFETSRSSSDAVIGALNNIIFRLLASTPVGKLSFTIIDPVKLGQNFAGVMHLADYEENLMNGRIWTEPAQIEERLTDLNAHMEKVIQMYLRNEYTTIAEYNAKAGNIAEKQHYIVIADFPANFSDAAVRRILRIAASGARCGVYTLIHWDHRQPGMPGLAPEELRKSSVCVDGTRDPFTLARPPFPDGRVILDAPPPPELATRFLHQVGEASRGANRVEVPFGQVAPPGEQYWSLNTTDELRVPIGRSGATKLQYLAVGRGTRQHALVAGKTGSGKSTLFHVIITNLSLWCAPDQVEFYLVDFKKGVEFKCYARHRLPHARVVAIESDREFGLSVLERLDQELRRRGDLFRRLNVQDIPGYKRAGGTEAMPRTLLIVDEFQEFFVEDDRISQAAAVLLDRIVRQGRAFGIHVLLGSQTLGGAYTLARTTVGQMVIRIALQCNEADAYLIMDENNPAPRLLSRPGEGVYNDMAGATEGNSPFQAVWLSDSERDVWLEQVERLAKLRQQSCPPPIVFEGNAPAEIRENLSLAALLNADLLAPEPSARVWLGAPNSIKGPTEAVFQNRSGNNLLLVGQREEAIVALISLSLIALSAQFHRRAVSFVVFESTLPGSPERQLLEQVAASLPHEVALARAGELRDILSAVAEELKTRTDREQSTAPPIFLIFHGVQNFKKLRPEDEYGFSTDEDDASGNASVLWHRLISEGPSHGIHVIASVDTYNNVNRYLGRKMLSEFELRVLFQMSANDSASLCDDPKASALGLHRALLYNEQEGYLETFRPYNRPDQEWLESAARNLRRLAH